MTWPTVDVSTTHLDSDADSPLSARADLLDLAQKFNQSRGHVTTFAATLLDDSDAATARTTLGLGTIATQAASSVALTGGTINGTAIGGSTPAAGAFTTLSATGAITATAGASISASSGAAVTVTNTGTGDSFVVNDEAGDASPFVIDASGRVMIGTTSVQTLAGFIPQVQIHGASTPPIFATARWSDDGLGAIFMGAKSRGTSVASQVAVQPNDILSRWVSLGSDGSAHQISAEISAVAIAPISAGIVPSQFQFWTTDTAGSLARRLIIGASGDVYPYADNTRSLGWSGSRWSVVYAGTGTINTSDARDKTPVRPLTDAELSAARQIASEIGAFRFLDAVAAKGDAARTHIGLTVQRVIEILAQHGLSPMQYAFVCHDEWPDEFEDVVTNPGEMRVEVRKVRQQRMGWTTVQEVVQDEINGQPVARLVERQVEAPVMRTVPVVDQSGHPVMKDGKPMQLDVPVYDEIERSIEVAADPVIERRKVREAGDRYSLRPDQLALFLLRAIQFP